MSIAGLLIALALSLAALAIVARPLLRPARRERATAENLRLQRDRLTAHYERALTNIRDLDEDFATGKINQADYEAEREAWVARGIRLLRAQDQLEREGSLSADGHDAARINRAIEEAVAAYREELQSAQPKPAEGDAS
ncbi:MAG: hypothetical protein OXI30_18465 [Chloroflexota bacterium]|nr:hypothetical protein [Chloroflexota bacterium]